MKMQCKTVYAETGNYYGSLQLIMVVNNDKAAATAAEYRARYS